MKLTNAKDWIQYAPQAKPGNITELWGYHFAQGGADIQSRATAGGPWYMCAACAARLQARGCGFSGAEATPIWTDGLHGPCEVCEPAPAPEPVIENDELILESYTEQALNAEADLARRRQIMAAGIARRLTGTAGDLTADMFGEGPTPLFNCRR